MRVALISGLGPASKNSAYLRGSLFDAAPSTSTALILEKAGMPGLRLEDFVYSGTSTPKALLRPIGTDPAHLTTFTLQSILANSRHQFVHVPTTFIWDRRAPGTLGNIDVALLSTTYIWNLKMLDQAVRWITEHMPEIPVVAGGQYTNLKYSTAMDRYPEIVAIVRGDGEIALPMVLDRLARRGDLAAVPNLVWRDGDKIRVNLMEYLDLDKFQSPTFPGPLRVAPYESMRGCPFDCKFCGFPLATPKWRYKSAQKIRTDWVGYAERNGVSAIEAMDSTFTVPPTRLRELFNILPSVGIPWQCFSRANVISSREFLDKLLAAHCYRLIIGFESMNEQVLKLMSKRVTAAQNRRAFDLLCDSEMDYSVCFIVGYPGESHMHFEDTRRFLIDDFKGEFQLHLFGISDETMPVWGDRELLKLEAEDAYDSDSAWSHCGMNSEEAKTLQAATLDEVRRRNSGAVYRHWQSRFEEELLPGSSRADNMAAEKAIERIAMVGRDYSNVAAGAAEVRAQIETLERLGVALPAARARPSQ
jgi:anaerobic magnesium-protoporphyrin IX monomethyl ester cyclase